MYKILIKSKNEIVYPALALNSRRSYRSFVGLGVNNNQLFKVIFKKCKFVIPKAENSMKQNFFRYLVYLMPVCFLAFGCAKIGVPSGGPSDKEIPVILKSFPSNGATGFSDKLITITFNEYVAFAALQGDPAGLFVVTVIVTILPKSLLTGVYVKTNGEDVAAEGTRVPCPLSEIVTAVALPLNVLPLTVTGVR